MPETITRLEILPHPFKADQRIFPLAISSRAAVNAGERPIITVTGTDGSEDRHGSVIDPDGWDLGPYRANPVVTWSHQDDTIPAIGRAPNPRRVGGAWDFDIEFAIEQWRDYGSGNLAALIYRLMKDDYLPAVSVAFIPKKWEDRQATTVPSFFAEDLRFLKQELTAISPCNVPSNRNGLKKALSNHAMTENEATLLGLESMIRVEMPIMIVTPAKASSRAATATGECACCNDASLKCGCATRDGGDCNCNADCEKCIAQTCDASKVKAAAKTAPPSPSVTSAAFRTTLHAVLVRCCGCEPSYCETPTQEPVDDAVRLAEITIVNDLAADCLQDLDTALNGWNIAESDDLRNVCSSRVAGAMYQYDWLAWWLDKTYGEAIGTTIPDISFEDVNQMVASAPDAFERAGAVFSSANLAKINSLRDNLSNGLTLCDDLIAAAKKNDSTSADSTVQDSAPSEGIRILIPGPSPSGSSEPESQLIRISTAKDNPGAGQGDRSTPRNQRDLYDGSVLRITR